MNLAPTIDVVITRLREEGADIRPIISAPWIGEIERKLKLKFPPSFHSLIARYSFPLLNIGSIELFANEGDGSEYDLTNGPFRDPIMSPWLAKRSYIHIGHPYIGNYDPICFDLSDKSLIEPPIVQLNHEHILCERKTVKCNIIAIDFLSLFEQAHYVA